MLMLYVFKYNILRELVNYRVSLCLHQFICLRELVRASSGTRYFSDHKTHKFK